MLFCQMTLRETFSNVAILTVYIFLRLKVALQGKDVEKVGERHVTTTTTTSVTIPITDANGTATTAAFADWCYTRLG